MLQNLKQLLASPEDVLHLTFTKTDGENYRLRIHVGFTIAGTLAEIEAADLTPITAAVEAMKKARPGQAVPARKKPGPKPKPATATQPELSAGPDAEKKKADEAAAEAKKKADKEARDKAEEEKQREIAELQEKLKIALAKKVD
jgi:hypothetical protein